MISKQPARTESEPERRPLIVLSTDRTLWYRLGISRLTYARALGRVGAKVRRHDYGTSVAERDGRAGHGLARELLRGAQGLVLAGGGDVDPSLYGSAPASARAVEPRRDAFEATLLKEAHRRRLPILAICRGAQLLNVVRGGTLRDLRSDPELRRSHQRLRGHPVKLAPDSRSAAIFGLERLPRVVSLHGQAVARVGDGLRIAGRADDGVVEAVEAVSDVWTVGVQWHPELSPTDRLHRRLFSSLVTAASGARSTGDDS